MLVAIGFMGALLARERIALRSPRRALTALLSASQDIVLDAYRARFCAM
jgi:hypothetical protein